jgi:lipopolysaccharide assembly protein A
MPESPAPHGTTSTLPPPSLNGSSRSPPLAPPAPQDEPPAPQDERLSTRISSMRTGLIAAAALTVVMIFIIQNAHAANISFLGIHLVLPLAVALILAAVAGALLMAAAGTARITQLRLIMRRARQKLDAG